MLAWRSSPPGFGALEVLSPSGELREAAARLFAALRRLDEGGVERIHAELVPYTGLGIAINDRLQRAAAR
jgi:L-threonylcarbamoyladenylate synthase